MAHQTYSINRAGLSLDVWIGLDRAGMLALQKIGQPILAPVQARALIDTGCNVTAISSQIITMLGLAPGISASTQTASGLAPVRLYDISLSIPDPAGSAASFVAPQLTVMELPTVLADADVLLGLDLVALWRLNIDGPHRVFTLEY